MSQESNANFYEIAGHVATIAGTSTLVGGEYLFLTQHDTSAFLGAEIGLFTLLPYVAASWFYNRSRIKRDLTRTYDAFEQNKRLDNNRNTILSLGLVAASAVAGTSIHTLPDWASYGLIAGGIGGAGGFAYNAGRSMLRSKTLRS